MEILSLKALSFTYPEQQNKALSDISLTVQAGEIVLLCGASGSGKSTLLRQLKPPLTPKGERQGSITFSGKDISTLDLREHTTRIAFVGQDPESMIVTDTVSSELSFTLESLGSDVSLIRRHTAEMAEFFGISDMYDRPVTELSGGQKQLLALASAMTVSPELLILDEPTSQLDPIAAHSFFEAVSRINRELGTTVIVSEHRSEEVFPLADKLIYLENGRAFSLLDPRSLKDDEVTPQLLCMLPAPARVFLCSGGKGSSPATPAQGREWLTDKLAGDTLTASHREIPAPGETSLKLKNICFRYSKDGKNILDHLNLTVRQGELLGILGGNGAGKSTLLNVISGMKKPLFGKLDRLGKVLLMPQHPVSLFAHDRLYDDFLEMKIDISKIDELVSFCELETLTDRHPSDLSGGELQRAALCKLMLGDPDILLLDEPTKGMDSLFKQRLGEMLTTLCTQGKTVIVVSHDAEFCAEYCTRCTMLFGGDLIGSEPPWSFFSENRFYTTSAARMSRDLIDEAVTANEIINALGGEPPYFVPPKSVPPAPPKNDKEHKPKTSPMKYAGRILSVLMFLFSAAGCMELFPKLFDEHMLIPYLMLGASVLLGAVSFSEGREVTHRVSRRRPSFYSVISSAVMLLLIPLTVYIGATYLNTGKYLFVSLLVMLEASLPFYLLFEGRKPEARELAAVAVLTAIAVAGRLAFYMLPQFKPVLAIVVISGAAFGGQTGFIVGSLSMLISNFMFGQGPWTPWQMFSMGIVGLLSGLIFERGVLPRSRAVIAVFGFFSAVVVYGGIVNPSTLFIMHNEVNKASLTAAYAAGLPLDIIHGAATLGFLYALAPSVLKKLERLKTKYGFFEV
ncbi:MAG: ATP-binding cassette domain-containing protein [Ruminococcus sp.]|nr:ATP-binding cassette domain-containing protein [Ruminococcus sp.]